MNFFAMQQEARRATRRMVVLFVLAVIAIVIAIDAVAVLAGLGSGGFDEEGGAALDYQALALVSVVVVVGIGLASLYRTLSLRAGGSVVARDMGATPVSPDTPNPQWRRLRNVIEEIAIASGVPVPDIYVMENESAINAFAAGYSPADAAVCVTQGCLDRLTRDELQGVIAHEFSHVLNGDMRLNIRLIGMLFGILCIGILGRIILQGAGRGRSRRDSGAAWVLLIGVGLLVVGYTGFFFGRLIQAAAARSRESLADASAVQFTRQADGIAGALKKIAVLADGSRLQAQETQQVAHMLFGEGLKGAAMFATHPPLLERIRALQPAFDPEELNQVARGLAAREAARSAGADADREEDDEEDAGLLHVPGMEDMPEFGMLAGAAVLGAGSIGERRPINAEDVAAQVATPGRDDYVLAGDVHTEMPPELAALARDRARAPALLLALAAARAADATAAEAAAVRAHLPEAEAAEVLALAARVRDLHPLLRLPLVALAFPALRRLPRADLAQLVARLDAIIKADGQVELDEYCLAKMVQVQVLDALDPAAAFARRRRRLVECVDEARDLFALVASFGNEDEEAARQAFLAACAEAFPDRSLAWEPPRDWHPAMDRALARLDRIGPAGKELVVRALVHAIRHDGRVTVAETELLRVICAALHCPLPPLLQVRER